MTQVTGRVALLTGCDQKNGIGSASAKRLAGNGVKVVVSALQQAGSNQASEQDGLLALVDDIKSAGGDAFAVRGDVRVESDTQRLVDEAIGQYGRLDVLINNAAAPHGADRDEIDNVPLSAWEEVMAVNARGPFLLTRAALPIMRRQRWGRIINIASAIVGQPRRLRTVYQASKAALVGFTQGLAFDVADKGITVNAICPGSILTERARSTALRSGFANPADAFNETARTIPAARHGSPEEIAEAVAFLASEVSGYITGQTLTIDGGGIPQYKR
jgi:NAD(P)-dependent dehydrogenase (short-subunit alcohol dehydrogenase family)